MAKRSPPKRRGKKRGRSHASGSSHAAVPARSRSWMLLAAPVCLGIAALVVWQPWDRPKPAAPDVQVPFSATSRHVTAVLDAQAGAVPQDIPGMQQEELSLAEALAKDFPRHDVPLALLASIHQYRGDTSRANDLWKQAIALNSKRTDLFQKIGQAAQRMDDLEGAIAWWERGLKANPEADVLRWEIANALITQGHLDRALTVLETNRAMASSDPRFPYVLGQIYLKQRAYEKAEPAYLRAIELRADYYSAYYGLGVAYSRLKQPDQARTAMGHFRSLKARAEASQAQQIMINELPHARKRTVASYIKAYSLFDPKTQGAMGQRLLNRALALDGTNARLWEKLGGHFYVNGRHDQALQSFEKSASLDPNNPLPCINIGKLYAQMNQMSRAEATLKKAVARFPESGLVRAELAYLYLRSQARYSEALALLKRAVALEPTAHHYFLLTWAYETNGNPKAAMDAIQKAVTLEPQNRRYRSTYERIRAKL